MKKCKTCEFWKLFRKGAADEEESVGICRRFPPVLDLKYTVDVNGEPTDDPLCWAQPVTLEDNTCGEHKIEEDNG
jgi:hypothetical protein